MNRHTRRIIITLACMALLIVLLVLAAIPAKAAEIESAVKPGLWREDVPLSAELQRALLRICKDAGVDPLLALGLIETESGFQPDIVSPWGDYGLCQLNYRYFSTDLTPEENMAAGIGLLAKQIERYGTVEAGLTAYNRGHDDGSRSYALVVIGKAQKWGYENG